jgi:hypothetical protein
VCGIDIGKAGMVATIRVPSEADPARRAAGTRRFGTAKREALAPADWLRCWQVPAVLRFHFRVGRDVEPNDAERDRSWVALGRNSGSTRPGWRRLWPSGLMRPVGRPLPAPPRMDGQKSTLLRAFLSIDHGGLRPGCYWCDQ